MSHKEKKKKMTKNINKTKPQLFERNSLHSNVLIIFHSADIFSTKKGVLYEMCFCILEDLSNFTVTCDTIVFLSRSSHNLAAQS